ncbi:MAG TPA: family 20 glycosylhydrolase [Oleiagrimonas sp.]|nr:family 20 glycosylhydrolase [Oleiagrimonas sp.]
MRTCCLLMFAAAISGLTGVAVADTAPDWSLIPQPAVTQPASHGMVTVADGDTVQVLAHDNPQASAIAGRFIALVASTRGLHLNVTEAPEASARIVFQLDPAANIDSEAGYRIRIGNGAIRVTARTPRGLFYGSVTTWQLLTSDPGANGPAHVANGRIADHPRYAWRGFMLDSARHFQSVAEIKQLIDWMALHKLDVLHWHLTDDQGWRLQIKQYPKLTSIGACRKPFGPDAALTGGPDQPYCGFYTQAQVRDLVDYAAARFITIVPEIDMPGHAQAAIAAYPKLGVTGERPAVSTDWGINSWLYAPDQHSIHFLENVLDEVMALFPSRYIHIGGDEAYKGQWKASPKVRAKLKRLGLKDMNALQNRMMGKIGAYLAAHGRTMVGWDEILHARLPDNAVVMSWHGVKGGVEAAAMGHDAVLSPSPTLYLDHVQSSAHDEPPGRPQVESLKDIYTFNPSPDSLTPAQADHILGLQANLWTEYMPTFARAVHAVFPRMAAWSEVAWSPASLIDWDDFIGRMTAQVARDQALGIAYADSAWAPRFDIAADHGQLKVSLSNQVDRGVLHYTTDGSMPTASSPRYTRPLELPIDRTTTLRVATYAADGLRLAAPRTRHLNAESLLTRNSDQLATCSHLIALRIEDDRPLDGPRPVYKVDIGNTCWEWKNAPMDGVHKITLRVGNLPWNYAIPYVHDKVVARVQATPGGEINVHLDSCTGPRIARLPLARAARTRGQTTLHATLPAIDGTHDLCLIATGDPRKGRIRVIDMVRLSPATQFMQ